MSKKRFYIFGDNIRGNFGEVDKPLNNTEIVNLLNEQQATIEKLEWAVDVKQRYIEKLEKRLEDE